MAESGCILIGRINELSGHEYGKRVYSVDGISPAVVCGGGGYQDIKIVLGDCMDYRIRKLTPRECFRLQGVKDEDYDNVCKDQSDSGLYHLAGDSITTTVLMAIFGELLDIDYMPKIHEVEQEISRNDPT